MAGVRTVCIPHHLRAAIPLPGNSVREHNSIAWQCCTRGLDLRVDSLASDLAERSADLLPGSLLSPIRKGVLVPSGFRRSIRFHGNLYKHICDTYSVLHISKHIHEFKTVIYHYT